MVAAVMTDDEALAAARVTPKDEEARRRISTDLSALLTDPRDSFTVTLDSPEPGAPVAIVVRLSRRFEGHPERWVKVHYLTPDLAHGSQIAHRWVFEEWIRNVPDSILEQQH